MIHNSNGLIPFLLLRSSEGDGMKMAQTMNSINTSVTLTKLLFDNYYQCLTINTEDKVEEFCFVYTLSLIHI